MRTLHAFLHCWHCWLCCLCCLPLGLLLPMPPAAADVLVTTLGEEETLRGISLAGDQKGLSLHSAEGQVVQVAAGKVIEITTIPSPPAPPEAARPFEVELVDGTLLRGTLDTGGEPGTLRVRCAALRETEGHLDLLIETVRAIRRVAGAEVPGSSRLVRIEGRDAAYRLSGARIEGFVARFLATHVEIERDGAAKREIPYGDLAALFVDNPELSRPTDLHLIARLADGSSLVLKQDFRIAGGLLSGTLPAGPLVRIPTPQVVAISFQGRSFVHLSDLVPQSMRREPFFPLPEGAAATALLDFVCPVRMDRSPDDHPITLRRQHYFKGIGVRPHTELTYELGGKFASFRADCGIDDEVLGTDYGHGAGTGSVVFIVLVDGKQVLETPPVEGGKAPHRVRVDLKGAQSLTLIVSLVPKEKMAKGQADSPELDNAVWARPLLVR